MGDLDKPLKGFGGAGVLEILEDDAVGGGTYRAVYTVRFAQTVFVLGIRIRVCFRCLNQHLSSWRETGVCCSLLGDVATSRIRILMWEKEP
jgi:hypothetical protein